MHSDTDNTILWASAVMVFKCSVLVIDEELNTSQGSVFIFSRQLRWMPDLADLEDCNVHVGDSGSDDRGAEGLLRPPISISATREERDPAEFSLYIYTQ